MSLLNMVLKNSCININAPISVHFKAGQVRIAMRLGTISFNRIASRFSYNPPVLVPAMRFKEFTWLNGGKI